jgi:hypothetical protein
MIQKPMMITIRGTRDLQDKLLQKSSFKAMEKASLSLTSMLRRRVKKLVPTMAIRAGP